MSCKFYCEHTGVLTEFNFSLTEINLSEPLFGSDIARDRHKEEESRVGKRLAHYRCFDTSLLHSARDSKFVWVKHTPSLSPKRYYGVLGEEIFSMCRRKDKLVPFVAVPAEFDDKAIMLAAKHEDGLSIDPFSFADILEEASRIGKVTRKGYQPLSDADLALLFGLSVAAVNSRRRLSCASANTKKMYVEGTLQLTQVEILCRLPENDQDDFAGKISTVSWNEARRIVSEHLIATNNLLGRRGHHRGKMLVALKVPCKHRKLSDIIAQEIRYSELMKKEKAGTDRYQRIVGILQGLRYALSMSNDLDKDLLYVRQKENL